MKENEKKFDEILKLLKQQDKRITNIEKQMNLSSNEISPVEDFNEFANKYEENSTESTQKHIQKKSSSPQFTFTQVITFLGVAGIIIGLISLFFYAVSRSWIGELGQILIGVFVGLMLYLFGISVNKKNQEWSLFAIGGALFIEYLSISVGILNYKVIPEVLGFFILLGFLLLSLFMSIKFNSKVIGYYSLVGGFLIPILTNLYKSEFFIVFYLIILSIALLILSYKFNWSDIRFLTFLLESIYILSNLRMLIVSESLFVSIIFLSITFLIYNIASIIFSIKNKEEINFLDIIVLNSNSLFFIFILYHVLSSALDITIMEYGFIMIPISFIYLIEIFLLKNKFGMHKIYNSTYYSIFSSAIISLNLAIFFILDALNKDFFIIPFLIEWVLFSISSEFVKDKDKKNYFLIVSNLFLALVGIWYFLIIRFDRGLGISTLYLLIFAIIPILFYILNKKEISKNFNGGMFLISIYLFIFSFSKYLEFEQFNISEQVVQVILSVMWLIYTLGMFKVVSYNKEARTLMMILIGITLIKIAFIDLSFLEGFSRIIGFIVFGIILLIGGYFIKNEVDNK